MSLYGAVAEAHRVGKSRRNVEVYIEEKALDGSNPTPVTTQFKTILGVKLTLKGSVAPGLATSTLTYNVVGAVVDVYAWMPTSATNPTLIASTNTETFTAVVFGLR